MLCIYIKTGFTCTACEGFVPLNAFVEKIRCTACGKEFHFTREKWLSLLDSPLEEVPHMEEGEGRNSTIFGAYNYRLEYGRICPKFEGTGDRISAEELQKGIDTGYVVSSDGKERIPVRHFEGPFGEEFQGVLALVGEDQSLLPGKNQDDVLETTESSKPVALQCPGCGGSLIVSGKQRREDCRYCGRSVTLPDELWQMLHPAMKAIPWYILLDEAQVPFKWDSKVYDAVPDGRGNLVFAVESDYSDCPEISCIDPDRKRVWTRDDLPVSCESNQYSPGMVPTPDGSLLLVHEDEKMLYRISMEDGSVLEKVEKESPSDVQEDSQVLEPFSMEEIRSMTCQPDGSLIVLKHRDNERGHYFNELIRYDRNRNPIQLWKNKGKEKKKPGLLQRIRSFFTTAGPKRPPYFSDLGDRPSRIYDSPDRMVSGGDGSVYMIYSGHMAAFDSEGNRMYSLEIPYRWSWGKPVPIGDGRVVLLVEESEDFRIACVSRTGEVEEIASGIGEDLDDPTFRVIVLDDSGILHVLGYGGEWKKLSLPDAVSSRND